MENNQNNQNSRTSQGNTNSNPQSSSNRQNSNMQSSSSTSSSPQGRSNQQGTSGKGGMKDIQDKLQQFGSATVQKVNNLSTTQKVVGGSLLALGAGWLALGSRNKNKIKGQVNSLASSAKDKMNKKDKRSGSSGSSSMDARVK